MTTSGSEGSSSGRQVLRAGLAAFGLRLVGRAVAYVFALLVARSAGAEVWGEFSLTLAYISAGAMISLTGFDTAAVKLTAEAVQRPGLGVSAILRRVLGLATVQAMGVVGLAWLFAPALASSLFESGSLAGPLRLGALVILPTALVNVCVGALNGLKQVAWAVTVQFVFRLGIPTLLFVAVPGWGPVVAYAIGNVVLLGIAAGLVRRLGRAAPGWVGPTVGARALYDLSVPLLLVSSMGFIRGWADTVLVGVFLDTASMGVYDIAFKLASIISLPLLAVNGIVAPLVAAAAADEDWAGVERAARLGASLSAVLAVVPAALCIGMPGSILSFFGPEFVSGTPTLRWLGLAYFLNASLGMGGYVMPMAGMHKTYQYIAAFTTALSILLNLVLLPRFGIVGAAYASIVSIVVNAGGAGGGLWIFRRVSVLPTTTGLISFLRRRFQPSLHTERPKDSEV